MWACILDDSRRCSQVKLGSAADFLLDISETDLSTLTASIKAPSGRDEPCLLKRLPNNHIGESRPPSRLELGHRRWEVEIPSVLSCETGNTLECDMLNLLDHTRDKSRSVFLCCNVDYLRGYSELLQSQEGSHISVRVSLLVPLLIPFPPTLPQSVPWSRHLLHPPGGGRTPGQHQEERQSRGE